MTVDEFNDKWKNHLEEGFEGLEFSDAEGKVVDLSLIHISEPTIH